jgi:CubicO group peptidase (beta-lactamase class C family)
MHSRKIFRCILLAVSALTAASSIWQSALAQQAKPSTESSATPDTAALLKSGDRYVVPRTWSAVRKPDYVLLSPSEHDTTIALVAVGAAADAGDAVQKAWSLYKPGSEARKIETLTPLPPEDGWDERKFVSFASSPNDQAVIQASAFRVGSRWLVMIADSSKAALERHSGAIGVIGASLLPSGYQPETFVGRPAHHLDAERVQKLKTFLSDSMTKLGVPGVGFAFVDNGQVVAEGGLGVRELGKPEQVTADTLFMIGSNTKGMTTLLMAKLVDEGKLSWDQPVTAVYPQFKLGNPETTKLVMVRHLACACTGLPRQDLEWLLDSDKHSPASLTFDLLAKVQPTSKFGEEFQYNNLMLSAAGYIAGHLLYPQLELGKAYDRSMREKIFLPLGMSATTFDFAKVMTLNHTSPHGIDYAGKPAVSLAMFDYPAVAPAGLAWSTPHDMVKYVQNEISEGVGADGQRLYSARNVLERRKPNVAMSKDEYYGMGIMTGKSGGVDVISHGGGTFGHLSNWYVIPDAKIGAVLLTNSNQGALMLGPFRRKLLEVIYDGKPEADAEIAAAAQNAKSAHEKLMKEIEPSPPADIVAMLARNYVSPELGHLTVRKADGAVYFAFAGFENRMGLRKSKDGPIILESIDPTGLGTNFTVEKRDGKNALTIRDGQHEYIYHEQTTAN